MNLRLASFFAILLASSVLAQKPPAGKNLAERLGYPRDAKLLIVNGDDLGMAHSIDSASTRALEAGDISSASIMVPCPWFPSIAAYARHHPQADFGLHLTLTSEWRSYRWGPVLSKDKVQSLLDSAGYFHASLDSAVAHIDPRQAEAELRAQIAHARAAGIHPTHLDSHMGLLYQSGPLFEVLLRVARENRLPVRVSKDLSPHLAALLKPGDVVIDRRITVDESIPPDRWAAFYSEAIAHLTPGVTELFVHLAYDNEEMRAMTAGHVAWGSAWRQRDLDFFTSGTFKQLLKQHGVTVITWRQIGQLLK